MAFKVTWLGHGTYWLEIGAYKILLDPFIDDNPSATGSAADYDPDFILLSHGHMDHIADTAPIANRIGCLVITNVEISRWLRDGHGVENISGHQPGAGATFPFGHVEFTIAVHGSGLPDGAHGGLAMGFVIRAEGKTVYFACDTGLFSEMQWLGEYGLDAAFLPIGDNFTMGPDAALKAVQILKPKIAVPKHFGTWPPIEQDGAAWVKRVSDETDSEGVLMEINGTLEL